MTGSSFSQLASRERLRRELLGASDRIPPLPDVIVRVLSLLAEPSTAPADLEETLRNDPVLVARILGLVGSPLYGRRHAARTVREAIVVLGFRGLRSVLMASASAQLLQSDCSCYGHDAFGLWRHSVAVAALAQEIARAARLGADQVEEVFVAGLLHDIGKMLLAPHLQRLGAELDGGDAALAAETAALGIDHAEAGARIAEKWNLGAPTQLLLGEHHARTTATPQLAALRLADARAHELGIGYRPGRAGSGETRVADVALLGFAAESWERQRDRLERAAGDALHELHRVCR